MTIIRKFVINEKILKNELMWEENKEKRELYKKTHTKEQKLEIYLKWKEFMNEICEQVSFFDYIKNYYPMNLNVLTKVKWTKDNITMVHTSYPRLETILVF